MAEDRITAYGNVAGLLRNMGYDAHVREGFLPPGTSQPATALVTCAPAVVLGMALGLTAEEPEAHLPERSIKAARPEPNKAGDPLFAWWSEDSGQRP